MTAETGTWPVRRGATLDWLVRESTGQPFIDNLFADVCNRLVEEGVPLARASLHLRTLHPQWRGARMLWRLGLAEAEILMVDQATIDNLNNQRNPIKALYEGAEGIRQRLDLTAESDEEYGIYADLRLEGMTDYAAFPLVFTDNRRHAVTFATTRPGGFTTEQLVEITELLPILGMAVEIRAKNRMAKNLLNAYVGRHAAEQILAGAITRGSGMTVRAAIWTCDLRGFTTLSELWPRDDVIALLNDYFDAMATPVEANGGEVLKFIGDALLAIFPMVDEDACGGALRAALEARRAMRAMNKRRVERGLEALGFGLALHVGDVMYGNIGSKERLDFTVIGPAVNVASRLENLSKELRREVLISGPFVGVCPCGGLGLEYMGPHPLKGVGQPLDVYALPEPG